MLTKFSELEHKSITENTTMVDPFLKDNNVTLEAPATSVMTDFQHIIPASIASDLTIDSACERMKAAKIRLLFVTNSDGDTIVGLITATDLFGTTPVKLSQELRVPRNELKIAQIMTPYYKLTAIPFEHVEKAQVGHVVKSLHEFGRQHTLVVDTNEEGNEVIRGMFSNNQICRQLGLDVQQILGGTTSLVDLIIADGKNTHSLKLG
jgi:CBS domain-containing protein